MRNEIVTTIIFVLLLVLFWNPFSIWMPQALTYTVIACLFVVTAIYAGLVLREKPLDEREEKHRASAGRIGFIVGVAVLVLGILIQSLNSHPDPWLIGALGGMIISKVVALAWNRRLK